MNGLRSLLLRSRLHLADFWLWLLDTQQRANDRAIRLARRKRARLIAQLPPEVVA